MHRKEAIETARETDESWDCVIVGGGPAGLLAALWLGRCQRKTLLVDSGRPRNAASLGLHGYLTRDGILPTELRSIGRQELAPYTSVKVLDGIVERVRRTAGAFDLKVAGATHRAKTVLLATGRKDTLPDIPGAASFYGRGLFHCPYCDGWEHRNTPLAILGDGRAAIEMASLLKTWSSDLTILTGGRATEELASANIPVVADPIARLHGDDNGRLSRIEFADGSIRLCRALFFCSDCIQRSELPETLGCEFDSDGSVVCKGFAATNVPGLFVAGNVRGGIHLAIMAAAEGAESALAINEYLLEGVGTTRSGA
jgi:thioredoxin reductase